MEQHKRRQRYRGLSLAIHFMPPSNTSYGCCTQVLPWHRRGGCPGAVVPATGTLLRTAGCWHQDEIHKPKWLSHKNNKISNARSQDQHRRRHAELSSSCCKTLNAAGTTHPFQRELPAGCSGWAWLLTRSTGNTCCFISRIRNICPSLPVWL